MQRRSRTDSATSRALLAAAVELVRTGGIGALTVRRLAQETHYSASAVGHHTVPFDQFVARVWRKIGIDLATEMMSGVRGENWALLVSDRLLRWVSDQPRLAEFFVAHAATPPADYGVDEWSFLEGMNGELPPDRTLATLAYLARRFQLALEHAVRWPADPQAKIGALAEELIAIDESWRRFLRSAASACDTQRC
jgi:hypothetical protein